MPITRDTYDEASRYMAQLANHAMKRKAAGEFDFDDASSGRTYKRTRSGCFTCRLRRKKCDEGRPSCGACVGLNVKCEYQQPNWWSSSELRHLQKGKVKDDIKANKVTMKNHHAYVGRHANSTSPMTPGFTFNPSYQPAENYSYSPDFQSASYGQQQQLQQLPPVFQSASYEEHQQIQPQPPVFQSAFYEQHQQIQQQPPVFQSAFYEQHPQLQQPLAQMQLQQQLPELDPQLQLQLPQLELPLPMPQIQLEQLPEFDPQLQLQPPPVFQSAFYEQYPQLQPPLAPMQLPQLSELDLQPQLDPQLDPQLQLQLQREQQEQQEQEQKRQEQERQMQKQQELEKAHQKQQEQERQKRKQQEQEKAKQKQREQERQKQKQQEQEKQKKKQQEQEKQKQKQQEQEKQKQRQRQQEQEKQKQKQQKQQEQQEQQKQKQSQEKQQEQEKQKQKQQEQQKQKGQQEQQKQKQKQPQQQPLYQVDVTTERQVFVNDVETQKETSVSSFKTSMPPPPLPDTRNPARFATDPMPGYPGPGPDPGPHSGPEPFPSRPRRNPEDVSIIIANDGPLLSHFIDNVLRFFFPISEARQGPEDHQRIKAILDSLEHNQSYFHCCLGVAAIHLRGTVGHKGKDFDSDILRHRFEAVSALSEALGKNEDYHRVLDSSLAMIIFHCAVASPVEDNLPDIAWYHHFEAAVSLLSRLGFLDPAATIHHINPPFSASLATWIDILGATMLGRQPRFAETYRVKNAEDTPSGLYQLMGCEDRVMYIISEIACLDALKLQGNANHIAVCAQIASLGRQLENSEPRDPKLEHPFVPATGELRADKLMKTITAIFRIAARVYLCSLVPGFDRHQESNLNLIEAGTRALDYLPDGPNGYDRCIVWPLLIIGTYSVPTSTIRLVLHRRMIEMGDDNNFGNWSRLYRVLVEIWRRSDGQLRNVPGRSHTTPEGAQIMRQTRPQAVHWRGVLIEKRWDYLLL